MKTRHNLELSKAISEAIADKEHEVWVWIGCGYVLVQDRLAAVIAEAIENF